MLFDHSDHERPIGGVLFPEAGLQPSVNQDRPLEVGKTWSRTHRLTNHANKTTTEFVAN